MDAGNPQVEERARPLTSELKWCMVTNLEENETFITVILFNTWNENKAAGVHFHLRHLYGVTNSLFELGTVAPPQYGRQ
jgi:hypothetical protein